jgi:hypothetical protein
MKIVTVKVGVRALQQKENAKFAEELTRLDALPLRCIQVYCHRARAAFGWLKLDLLSRWVICACTESYNGGLRSEVLCYYRRPQKNPGC